MSGQRNEGDFIVLERKRSDHYVASDTVDTLQERDWRDSGGASLLATFNAGWPRLYPELSGTLRTNQRSMGSAEVLVQTLDARNGVTNPEISGTLQAKSKGYSLNYINPLFEGTRLRRFTPKEVTRLQGFPDNWLEGYSDTFVYSAMGDTISLPVSEWILRRIAAYERRKISGTD